MCEFIVKLLALRTSLLVSVHELSFLQKTTMIPPEGPSMTASYRDRSGQYTRQQVLISVLLSISLSKAASANNQSGKEKKGEITPGLPYPLTLESSPQDFDLGSQAWLKKTQFQASNETIEPQPEPAPGAPAPSEPDESQHFEKKNTTTPPAIIYPYRWENSFNLLFTNLFGKNLFDFSSPSYLAEGIWTYKFQTGTAVGLLLMGSLYPMAVSRDEAKLSFTTYGVGPYLGQDIFRTDDYRLVASLSMGKGYLYVRRKSAVGTGKEAFYKSEYLFYEPSISFIFFQTRFYEIGPIVSYRKTSLSDPLIAKPDDRGENIPLSEVNVATEKDIDGLSIGFSARSVLF